MSDVQKGGPTGKLDAHGRMMEVRLYRTDGNGQYIDMGTRWIPVTEEQRQKIMSGNTQVVSMGAVNLDQEMMKSVYSEPCVPVSPSTGLSQADPNISIVETAEEDEEWRRRESGRWPRPAEKTENASLLREVAESVDTQGNADLERLQARLEAARRDPTGMTRAPALREWCNALKIDLDEQFRAFQKDEQERKGYIVNLTGNVTGFVASPESKITGTSTISELTRDDMPSRQYVEEQVVRAATDRRAEPEHSGGNVNYYSVRIDHPKRPEREPYTFEVEDLIQALSMGFHEATVLKSLVRQATERELGLAKKGGDAIRDAEKMIHSSQEHLRALKLKKARQ